ncbi:Asp-tRNA(Asn)/Glu-tRNA(Gln) amidotransferase subunit GatA [Aerococcaceae bacterium DSM 111021]|nr:Asp-tRNA(Asn)/Glu-tRNA(Gln) amidotransferase subunit GatA [Aerococcaceae bacterium DSM 111021]
MSKYPTTIIDIQTGLKNGEFTAVELTESVFAYIEETDDKVNSFLALNKEAALEAAKKADEVGYGEDAPLLNGVPIGIKDNIVTEDLITTASSKMLENFNPTYDATVIKKLKEAGAIIIGKLNLDEFAMGGSTETSYFKTSKNPWDLERVPGGSSGGSSSAVAARQVPASLGTDTGGSVRNPAAFTGIVGMKPSYGSVSRFGAIAFGSSLDQIGPMTISVEDNALVLEAIAGYDKNDGTSRPDVELDYRSKIGQPIEGMRIAFPKEYQSEAVNIEIREAIAKAKEYFISQGAIVDEVSLPHTPYGINVYYILSSAEASSNLQRFDGIRYGYRSESAKTLEDIYVQSRSEGFGTEVKRRIMLGTYSLSSGAFDKYYKKAAQVRTLIIEDFIKVFNQYDLIMGPVTTSTAFKIGGRIEDPVEMYVSDLLTVPVNLAGLPAMSVPAGFDSNGMPIGLQLIGKHLDESTLYQVAYDFEQNHDYVNQVPEF